MNRFNIFCVSVVDKILYKDIPFWTTLLGKDFYPNHSFWDEFSGDIFIKTTDNFRILNFKIECIWIKYNRYYKNLKLQYLKNYGEEIQYIVENDAIIDGIEYFNRNAKLYFEETGIWIGAEPQNCEISNKFWEFNDFIERTRSFNVYQMKEVEMIYEPTLEDVFKKKIFPQYL